MAARAGGTPWIVGARALIVHAIDDEAVPFDAGFGFRSFAGDVRTMFLPMEAIKRAV